VIACYDRRASNRGQSETIMDAAKGHRGRILVVDDDRSVTASLSLLLKQAGFTPVVAYSPAEALELLQVQPAKLVIQDMNFSRKTTGDEGLELLRDIQRDRPGVPVILITAWGSISLAVQGVKAGAFDFVTKPWGNEQLLGLVRTALSLAEELPSEAMSREELDERFDFSRIVGQDPGLLRLLETVGRVCATDAAVLLLGESGTGKELIAEALHENSKRDTGPFVKVNLGGVSSSLFESEMFGHVKGAFTDADSDRDGRFALADKGTIFLDEIGDLERLSQVKMLRVLQDRTYEVLGSSKPCRVDVRVVSATNRDLPDMVRDGSFREDLLYRLNLITLRLPPLRERRRDIPLLANLFLQQVVESYGIDRCSIEPVALEWLKTLAWPGNIRQLKQTVERAVLMAGKHVLGRHDFVHPDLVGDTVDLRDGLPPVGGMTLDEIEKAMIEKSLAHYNRNITRVAQSLGLSRAALYRRIEKHGIQM
jgi:two-component system NtrC family response regulator